MFEGEIFLQGWAGKSDIYIKVSLFSSSFLSDPGVDYIVAKSDFASGILYILGFELGGNTL